jgi:hypothetical protein
MAQTVLLYPSTRAVLGTGITAVVEISDTPYYQAYCWWTRRLITNYEVLIVASTAPLIWVPGQTYILEAAQIQRPYDSN